MLFLVTIPYVFILLGVGIAFVRIQPKMLAWATIMCGGLISFCIAITLFVSNAFGAWVWELIAFLPFLIILTNVIKDLRHPRINDVTTDIKNPPTFVAAKEAKPNTDRDMEFPAKFGPIILESYPDLKPLYVNASPLHVVQRVLDIIDDQPGWTKTRSDHTTGLIEAEVSTAILRFVDDVVIRVEQGEQTTRIDMRSKSREGLIDGGYNAKRINSFLQTLSAKIT